MKTKKIIFIFIILMPFLYITYCYISVIDIYYAVEYAYLTKNGYNSYLSKYMTAEIFETIHNNQGYGSNEQDTKKELNLMLVFSINNFISDGLVWMYYSIFNYDQDGQLLSGSNKVPICFQIRRENGNWKIFKKYEGP